MKQLPYIKQYLIICIRIVLENYNNNDQQFNRVLPCETIVVPGEIKMVPVEIIVIPYEKLVVSCEIIVAHVR